MKIFILSTFILANAFASNVLVIGDSHTAGPYGQLLHKRLSKSNKTKRVMTLGHASSSSTHWMKEGSYKLSGGVFHQFLNSYNNQIKHPNPTHWRVKVEVPKLVSILDNPSVHSNWRDTNFRFDTVVIGLGANDARAISDENGVVNPWEYPKRQNEVIKMVDEVLSRGMKCLWIGPPNGKKKTKANQDVLYKMLKDAIGDKCEFFSSNHYKALGCDGVHFNCASEMHNARKWSKEASKFILENI